MVLKSLGNAFKKMSQRALWRGDRSQSEMLENHGMFGMRSNMLRDTPSYKKEGIGMDKNQQIHLTSQKNTASGVSSSGRNTNTNTKVKSTAQTSNTDTNVGKNIMDGFM